MKSMLSMVSGGAIAVMAATALSVGMAAQSTTDATPTFNKDVAAIIFDNCSSCHRPNQVAPMTFSSYKNVRPWARAIRTKVISGEMPPWFADPRYGEFSNDRRLSAEEIRTIVAWVDGGAPEGATPLTAQVPQEDGGGWAHPSGRPPDLVMEMGNPFTVPAGGELPNFTLYEKAPAVLSEKDHYVEAYQFIPGAIPVVHHGNLNIGPLPPGTKIGPGEAWPGGPMIPGALLNARTGRVSSGRDEPVNEEEDERAANKSRATPSRFAAPEPASTRFGPYLPGSAFVQFPPGAGKLLSKDAGYMRWGMHYTPVGKAFVDKSRVGIWFQKELTDEIVEQGGSGDNNRNTIINGEELVESPKNPLTRGNVPAVPVIPPNAKDWTYTVVKVFLDDYTLYALTPHMHQRGKAMTYVLTYPDGTERILLANLKYDFNWQIYYALAEPIKIPAGSVVKQIGYFDNSAANKYNPTPEKEVYWSEQSWDDMFSPFMDLSVDKFSKKRSVAGSSQNNQ